MKDVMMESNEGLHDAMFKRRSVRRYEEEGLDEVTLGEVRSFVGTLRPLFPDIRTEFRLLSPSEVKGLFKTGSPHYLALFSERKGEYLANAGFMLQQADLFFSSKGIGSCWQGTPKPSREVRAADGLEYVIMIGFGRGKGEVHRDISEFKRKPMEEITDIEGARELLEGARLAPSAINAQAWFFTGSADAIDVYRGRSSLTDRSKQIDAGIAMCHIWLAAMHAGKKVGTAVESGKEQRKGFEYVATMRLT